MHHKATGHIELMLSVALISVHYLYTLAPLREHSAYALAKVANRSEQIIIRFPARRTERCYYSAAYTMTIACTGSASSGSSDSFSSQHTMLIYTTASNNCCVTFVFMSSFSVSQQALNVHPA
jgi:hypothetical protein